MYTSCSDEMGCKGEFQLNLLCPPTTKLWYWPNLWTETGGGGRFLNEQERDFWRPVLGRSLPLYWAGCFFLLIFHPNWGFSRNFFQKLSSSEVLEVVLVNAWKICCSFIILVADTSKPNHIWIWFMGPTCYSEFEEFADFRFCADLALVHSLKWWWVCIYCSLD